MKRKLLAVLLDSSSIGSVQSAFTLLSVFWMHAIVKEKYAHVRNEEKMKTSCTRKTFHLGIASKKEDTLAKETRKCCLRY